MRHWRGSKAVSLRYILDRLIKLCKHCVFIFRKDCASDYKTNKRLTILLITFAGEFTANVVAFYSSAKMLLSTEYFTVGNPFKWSVFPLVF